MDVQGGVGEEREIDRYGWGFSFFGICDGLGFGLDP